MKLHFSSSYDVIKSNGRVPNISIDTLNKNISRKHMIQRISRRFKNPREVVQYLLAQHMYQDNNAIFDPMQAEENFKRWEKNKISMTRIILDDLMENDVAELLAGDPPNIFNHILGGRVHIETAVALHSILRWSETDYFPFQNIGLKIRKLEKFIKFDLNRVTEELENQNETKTALL